jgi:hypothetical protein
MPAGDAEPVRRCGEVIAEVLNAIPRERDEPRSIRTLFEENGVKSGEEASATGMALVALLQPFGALQVTGLDPDGAPMVKATAVSSWLFLRSIAAFLIEDLPLLTNWERLDRSDGPFLAADVLSGPQILYLMELARTGQRPDAMELQGVRVVKVLVKRPARGRSPSLYLVQFDGDADQYQLIGGKRLESDPDVESAAAFEVRRELRGNAFELGGRDRLSPLGDGPVTARAISRTYGAMTEYEIHFFQLHHASPLRLSPSDRWVTREELLAGRTADGMEINAGGLAELDGRLPGGLDGLAPSLAEMPRRRGGAQPRTG